MENFPIPNEPVLQCKPSPLMATHRRATTIMGQISFTERVWPKECNNKTRKSSRKSWMPIIFTKFGLRKSSSQHVIPGQIPTIINNVCQIYKTRKIISQKVDASKIHQVLVFCKEELIKPFPVYLPICSIKYGGNKPENQNWNLSPHELHAFNSHQVFVLGRHRQLTTSRHSRLITIRNEYHKVVG